MIPRLLPFAALILAAGLIFGYIVPTYQKDIVAAQARIRSYDNALVAYNSFKQKEDDLAQQRSKILAANLARLELFLPDGVNNIQLIIDLDNLAAHSGVVISNFNINPNSVSNGSSSADGTSLNLESASPVDSVQITVETVGTYAQFRTFLNGIENSLRPLDITSLAVSPGSSGGTYKYNLTIRIYWLH